MLRRSKSSTEPNKTDPRWVGWSTLAIFGCVLLFFVAIRVVNPDHAEPRSRPALDPHDPPPEEISLAFSQEACAPALLDWSRSSLAARSLRCGRVTATDTRNLLHPVHLYAVHVGCEKEGEGRCTEPPLLVFAGGPGDAMTPDLHERLDEWALRVGNRGMIFIDARGTGQSQPALTCPQPIHRTQDLERCFERWNQEIDLDSFGTSHHVADAALVLDALGVEAVAVYGVSYGTHLATEFARAHPARVRSLILDSPIPRGVDVLAPIGKVAQDSLGRVLAECHRMGACSKEISLSELGRFVTEMDRKHLSKRDPKKPTGTQFATALVHLLNAPRVLPYVPYLMASAQKGDFELFERLRKVPATAAAFSWGMHLSVQCAERFPLTSEESMLAWDAELLDGLVEAWSGKHYLDYCRIWKVAPRPVQELPTKIDVRTLVANGAYDSVTPLGYAEQVAKDFIRVQLVQVPGVGHGALLSPCGTAVMQHFLGSEREVPPQKCDAPSFATSGPSDEEVERMRHDIYHRL